MEDSKYINGLCDGINSHKIKVDNEIYYLKESCSEIQKERKQAKISEEDLNKLLKIIDDYNEVDVHAEGMNNIPFERAYLATGLSSSTVDYFSVEDAVLVDYFNIE